MTADGVPATKPRHDPPAVIKTAQPYFAEYENEDRTLAVQLFGYGTIYIFGETLTSGLSFGIQQAIELHACLTQALADYEAAQAGEVSA